MKSHFFGDLDKQLPDFGDVFTIDHITQKVSEIEFSRVMAKQTERLETYIRLLEQEYGSRDDALDAISEVYGRIEEHFEKSMRVIPHISGLEGDLLIKVNTVEAFADLFSSIYMSIQNTMRDVGIEPQS